MGLRGVVRGKETRTTIAGKAPCPADRVNRQFRAARPNLLWLADFSVPQQAALEMGAGPPQSACRSRLQTTVSGVGQKPGS
jgi:hypothetical protein